MTRITKAMRAAEEQANRDACAMFGHLPEPAKKPGSFGEMHNTESMKCSRCGVNVEASDWRSNV